MMTSLYDLPKDFNAATPLSPTSKTSKGAGGICFGASVLWAKLALALKPGEKSSLPPLLGQKERCRMIQFRYENWEPEYMAPVGADKGMTQRWRAMKAMEAEGLAAGTPSEVTWNNGVAELCEKLFGDRAASGTFLFHMRGKIRNGGPASHFMAYRKQNDSTEFFDANEGCVRSSAVLGTIYDDFKFNMQCYLWDSYIQGPAGEVFNQSVLLYQVNVQKAVRI